jgi:hydroxyacylglutathione hydrolase
MKYKIGHRRFLTSAVLVTCMLCLTASRALMYGGPAAEEAASVDKFVQANKYFKAASQAFLKGNYKKAERGVKQCLSVFDRHAHGHFLMSQLLYRQGHFPEALEHIKGAEADFVFLREWSARFQKGQSNKQKAERMMLRSALQELEASFEQYDCTRGISQAISATQKEIGRFDSRDISSANKRAAVPAEYAYLHGNILFKLKKYDLARVQYLKAVNTNPRHANGYNNLVNLLYLAGEYRLALDYAKQAVDAGVIINPDLQKAVLAKLGEPVQPEEQKLDWDFPGEEIHVHLFAVDVSDTDTPSYENTYVVYQRKTGDAVIIDPGVPAPRVEQFIVDRGLQVGKILNTHGHRDHIGGNRYFADRFGVKIAAHEADSLLYSGANDINRPDEFFSGDKIFKVGGLTIRTLHTPGHTVGSVCFLIGGHLISGDTLFKQGIGNVWGRTAAEEEAKMQKEVAAIKEKLLPLPGHIRVYPGHGPITTIDFEKKNNPFLK